MGSLNSAIDKIEAIHFNPLGAVDTSGDVLKVVSMGHSLYVLGKNNGVRTNAGIGGKIHLVDYTHKEVKALFGLGRINKDEYQLHVRWMNVTKEHRDIRSMVEGYKERSAKLGVILTKKQLKVLDDQCKQFAGEIQAVAELVEKMNKEYAASKTKNLRG